LAIRPKKPWCGVSAGAWAVAADAAESEVSVESESGALPVCAGERANQPSTSANGRDPEERDRAVPNENVPCASEELL
jgi:hypothetical protein